MNADIINFPEQHRDRRLTVGLERFAREIEGLMAQTNSTTEFGDLLDVTEGLSERLMELGCLLLDDYSKLGLQTAFDRLSARIAQARQALDAVDDPGAP